MKNVPSVIKQLWNTSIIQWILGILTEFYVEHVIPKRFQSFIQVHMKEPDLRVLKSIQYQFYLYPIFHQCQ
jgi:hypothetical protein